MNLENSGCKMAKKRKEKWTAKTADLYELYTEAVQAPEAEVKFARRVYRKATGKFRQ